MIDLAHLNRLLDGNEQLVKKYLKIFEEQAPRQVSDLIRQINIEDWESVSCTAHSLKSQLFYLNLVALADKLSRIELIADAGTTEGIRLLASEIEKEFYNLFKENFPERTFPILIL